MNFKHTRLDRTLLAFNNILLWLGCFNRISSPAVRNRCLIYGSDRTVK